MAEEKQTENWEQELDRELERRGSALQVAVAEQSGPESDGPADPANSQSLREIIFSGIRHGGRLPVDICDETGAVVVPAGSRMTKAVLRELRERGLERVNFRVPSKAGGKSAEGEDAGRQSAALHTGRSRILDERLAGELLKTIDFRPVKGWRRPRLPIQDLKAQAREGIRQHENIGNTVADLCESLKPGKRVSSDTLRQSMTEFVNLAAVDFDLLPLIVALQQSKDEYFYDHCVNVALLSMAMSSQLGLRRDEIAMIGLAGLLQDIGMLRVPESIRLGTGPLTDEEHIEIRRHPLHTLDMLADLKGVPPTVQFIAYQMHERFDGSGYPRGRAGNQLHQYSRLVALADVFSAMTRSRPHREAMSPYQAMKTILFKGAANKFDRDLIRTLLDTISLFPIGSTVGLSDGTRARVLRANPERHTRPVVEPLSDDGTPTGEIIDVSQDGAPTVVTAT